MILVMGNKKLRGKSRTRTNSEWEERKSSRQERRGSKHQGLPMSVKELTKMTKGRKHKNVCNHAKQDSSSHTQPWAKVVVKSKTNVEKAFLYETLSTYISSFVPFEFTTTDTGITFYLEEPGKLNELHKLHNSMQNKDGNTISFEWKHMTIPSVSLTHREKSILSASISSRFCGKTLSLDLSYFHDDPIFKDADILLPLMCPTVAEAIVEIVLSNIPSVHSLSLSGNKLCCLKNLRPFQPLFAKYPLEKLHIENNRLEDLYGFKHFETTAITEIFLKGNSGLINTIVSVKAMFPKCHTIDGILITPKPISVDIVNDLSPEDDSELEVGTSVCENTSNLDIPDEKTILSVDLHSENLKTYFMKYISAMDSNRSELQYGFTEDALVEVTSGNPEFSTTSVKVEGLEEIGRLLAAYPQTTHLPETFNLEFEQSSTNIGLINVTGEFVTKELPKPLQFISKMVVVPYRERICCRSLKLHIL